jgi:hypothetical protein
MRRASKKIIGGDGAPIAREAAGKGERSFFVLFFFFFFFFFASKKGGTYGESDRGILPNALSIATRNFLGRREAIRSHSLPPYFMSAAKENLVLDVGPNTAPDGDLHENEMK